MDEKKKNVPKRRFKEFKNADAWEQREFSELVNKLSKTSASNSLPKIEFEDIISGEGRLNKDVSTKFDNRKGILFNENNILYGKLRPYLKNWLYTDFKGIALGDFWVFEANYIEPKFLYFLIQADIYQKTANDTSGTKMPRSDWQKVSSTKFYVPRDLEEQIKIGNLLMGIEETLTLHQRKLEKYKAIKESYLEEMFPAEGQRKPKRRFPGFTDDWEQRELGDVVKITMGQSPNSINYTNNPGDYILVQGNADMKNGFVHPRVWTTQITKTAEVGDIILSVRAPVGDVAKTDYDIVLGRGVAGIKGNQFIFQLLKKYKEDGYWKKISTGSTFESINSNIIKEAKLLLPSAKEQNYLGDFFYEMDQTITLHQKKLDKLKKLKEALLEEMFV